MAVFRVIWGVAGDLTSVASFCTSWTSVCDVRHRRTIPDIFLLLSYVLMFGSTLAGFCYSLPFADADSEGFSPFFLAGELACFIMTSCYLVVITYHCTGTLRWCAFYGWCVLAIPSVLLLFFACAILDPTEKSRTWAKKTFSWSYAILSSLMYLMSIILVQIQSGMTLLQKCQSISIWKVLPNLMSCYIWLIYSMPDGQSVDYFTLVPNGVGITVSLAQLFMSACGQHPVCDDPALALEEPQPPLPAQPSQQPTHASPAIPTAGATALASLPAIAPRVVGPVLTVATSHTAAEAAGSACIAAAAIAESARIAIARAVAEATDSTRVVADAAVESAHTAIACTTAEAVDSTRVAANAAMESARMAAAHAATVAADSTRAATDAAVESARVAIAHAVSSAPAPAPPSG